MRSRATLLAALLLCTAAGARPAGTELIERVLAVVDRRPILLSEVRAIEALRGIERQPAMEALVDETLMYAEATRFAHAHPTPQQDAAALASLRANLPPGVSIPESDLQRMAHRQATILKYVGLRFRPLVRVTDEELRKAYETQYRDAAAAPFQDVADELALRITEDALDRRIDEWVRQLREGSEIRYVPDAPGGS